MYTSTVVTVHTVHVVQTYSTYVYDSIDFFSRICFPVFFPPPLASHLWSKIQATKAELKAKSEALATNDRQRVQYEAIAKSKQQQLDQLMAAKIKMQEDLEAREKAALAKAAAAEGEMS